MGGSRLAQPARRLGVARQASALEAPRDRLGERPEACALAVESELRCQAIEPVEDVAAAVAELEAANQRRDCELALARERLRVDREPRLPPRAKNVARMEILVKKHLLALRMRKRCEGVRRGVEQRLLDRPAGALPGSPQAPRPPGGLCGEGSKRCAGRFPETWEETDGDVECCVLSDVGERRPRVAPLEEKRVALRVVAKEADRAFAAPEGERSGLVLALPARELHLEDGTRSIRKPRGDDERDVPSGERLAEREPPRVGAFLDEARQRGEPCSALGGTP